MSRHRTVRTMNYDDEYDGYYDEYGHSVEDDFCISPNTAAQFMYDRSSKDHSISSFINPEIEEIEEEEEENIDLKSETCSISQANQQDHAQLHTCVEAMQNVVGDTIPDSVLRSAAIRNNYSLELALEEVLFSDKEAPKPQRIPKQRNRDRKNNKIEEKEKLISTDDVQKNINSEKLNNMHEENLKKNVSIAKTEIKSEDEIDLSTQNEASSIIQTVDNEEKSTELEISDSSNEVLSTPKTKKKIDEKELLVQYQKERGGEKPLLNMVVIGHVDAGKSTLMGHLLYKLDFVKKKMIHKYEQESKKMGKASFVYAWVLDETKEERTRGITMDVGQSRFETPHHTINLLDAPGHKDFIPNMITGAAQADVAVLVVDATVGEFETGFEAGGQTREHTMLVRSLGVSQLGVAVNKLDNVNWSKDRYNEIVCRLGSFLKQAGFKENDVTFVPCSGLTGENLNEPAKIALLKAWYKGPCLVEVIDKFKSPDRPIGKPLRVSVNDVYKGMGSGFCISGKIEAGYLQNGDKLSIMPAGELANVKGIAIHEVSVTQAFAGDNVVVSLLGADINKITTGSVLCDLNKPIKAATRFQARIVVFNIEIPITKGFPVILHYQSMSEQAIIRKLLSQLHKSTGQVVRKKPRCITKNSSAIIEIEVSRPICIELYKDLRELGRFMLRSAGLTIAAGVITEIL